MEILRYPHNSLNFGIFESRENREHRYIEVSFELRGATNQSYEGRNLQWQKIFVIIYARLGLITCGVSERNIYTQDYSRDATQGK